jgi:dolichyl-phosphate beta-glucosyltransferase
MALPLSIIIPAYNEEKRIGPSLDEVLRFLTSYPHRAEVIVVDDGSSDSTARSVLDRVEQYRASGYELRLLTNTPNRGKGYSVKRGITNARGDVALFTDADLSSPISEAPKLIEPILEGRADVTFGSRAINRKLIGVRQPIIRDFGGRVFNFFMRMITGLKYKDTQCGFKAFRRELSLPAFQLQRVERFGFDPEVLYIARKHGLRLLEVPVVWNDSEGSKVDYIRDSAKMCSDLVYIRLNDLLGRYQNSPGKRAVEEYSPAKRTPER